MKILVIIPARGGSKGVPRKNIRFIGNKPLIAHSIEKAISIPRDVKVIVTTEDDEISKISSFYGAVVIMRPNSLPDDSSTLDPVVFHAVSEIERFDSVRYDIVITFQPTSPLLNLSTLNRAIEVFITTDLDTLISVHNSPHLSWRKEFNKILPNYEFRLNRQYLPKHYKETGAFIITKREFVRIDNRFGPNIEGYEVSEIEAVDIDSPHDWWIVDKELNKKNLILRVEGYSEIGLGHIYRCLVIANNLIDHNIKFVLSKYSDLGIKVIKNSGFDFEVMEEDSDLIEM